MPTPSAAPPVPRTLRLLMAERGIFEFKILARLAKVHEVQVSHINGGWKGTPEIRRRLAKAMKISEADLLAAARAAHDEVPS